MIRFYDCDYCNHNRGMREGHPICDAFPNGVPYEHMDKDLKNLKECNKGIGFIKKTEGPFSEN